MRGYQAIYPPGLLGEPFPDRNLRLKVLPGGLGRLIPSPGFFSEIWELGSIMVNLLQRGQCTIYIYICCIMLYLGKIGNGMD